MIGVERDIAVIVVAAGTSERFGKRNKLLVELSGKTVLSRSIEAFSSRPSVREIVVVVGKADADACIRCAREVRSDVTIRECLGGASRRESVHAGLAALETSAPFVAIHDAARPLVEAKLVDRVVSAARRTGAALPVVPITDTVFDVASDEIRNVVPRDGLRAAQTPQVFRRDWLLDALGQIGEGTDEASALFQCGYPISLVEGSVRNIKITWPQDVAIADALLNWRRN